MCKLLPKGGEINWQHWVTSFFFCTGFTFVISPAVRCSPPTVTVFGALLGPAHLQRAIKPESANAGRNLFQPHVASFFPKGIKSAPSKKAKQGTGCPKKEGTPLFSFVWFDKLFMCVVFVTGFCNRVSALESRREGLNGGFVKAGSAFYRLIWPSNLATGAGLGCNPRNKKEKKKRKKFVCSHVSIGATGLRRKNNLCSLSAHRSQSVGMFPFSEV